MNKRSVIALLAIVTILISPIRYVYAAPKSTAAQTTDNTVSTGLTIGAPSAILMESERGQILYAKEPHIKLHISAACKIMTALVAVEKAKLDAKVTVSKESVDSEGSALSLEVGEKYSVEDLLYGIMLTSANDAAKAIAEFVGGDVGKFVDLMNAKAAELDLKDTHFTNPTGLSDENQYTTAYDVAVLTRHAISNPVFRKVFSTQFKPWYDQDGSTKLLQTQNKLFWRYDGVDGGKIGYNNKEQQSSITTASKDNQKLICIVLDTPEETMYEDTTKLFDYGFTNFKHSILIQKGDPQTSVKVGETEISLVSQNTIYYTHPLGESYIKDIQFDIAKNLALPVLKNKAAGTVKYILNDNTVIDVSLYPETDVLPPEDFYASMYKKFTENKDILYLVAFLLAVEVLLILYNIIKLINRLVRKIFIAGKR